MIKDRLKQMIDQIRSVISGIREYRIDVYSAATAFYMFLSVIPFFIALFSIVPYTPLSEEDVLELTSLFQDKFSLPVQVVTAEAYVKSSARLLISLILSIWSAARGIMYMTKGLNCIYNVEERRGNIILRLWACLYTMAIVAILMILMLMGVFGRHVVRMIRSQMPENQMHVASWITTVIDFRTIIILIFLFIVFILIYTFLPNKRVRWVHQTPGAALCSISWWLFTKLFSLYIDTFGGFTMYGSLATVAASMLWLYFCMFMMFLFAGLNQSIQWRSRSHSA